MHPRTKVVLASHELKVAYSNDPPNWHVTQGASVQIIVYVNKHASSLQCFETSSLTQKSKQGNSDIIV